MTANAGPASVAPAHTGRMRAAIAAPPVSPSVAAPSASTSSIEVDPTHRHHPSVCAVVRCGIRTQLPHKRKGSRAARSAVGEGHGDRDVVGELLELAAMGVGEVHGEDHDGDDGADAE